MTKPHWNLWAIGVNPEYWSRGIGSHLLRTILISADASGLACYLETHNEKNTHFYEKHGFEVVFKGTAPRHNLQMWAMLRER